VFTARSDYRDRPPLWRALRDITDQREADWTLRSGLLMSFHDLEASPWHSVCDAGTVEAFRTQEWARSDDQDRQRDFVELLNWSLREKLYQAHVGFCERLGHYYFLRTPSLKPRKISFRSLARGSHRTVFQGYPSKEDATKMRYYRHMAFEGQFRRFADEWFLEICPTYHFTRDGEKIDPWYYDKVAGMRRLEKNAAVLQQVVMWGDYLVGVKDQLPFVSDTSPKITFDRLMSFEVPLGVDDANWLATEEDEATLQVADEADTLSLFNE
jgi:hypothetical protein